MSNPSRRRGPLAALAVVLIGAAALVSCRLPGATFTVNRTTDAVDRNPGDGVCEATAGAGDCTLRAAVMEANALPGGDNIDVSGHLVLSLVGAGEDAGATGDLDVTDDVNISGPANIQAQEADRIFDVHHGTLFVDGASVLEGFASAPDLLGSVGAGFRVAPGAGLDLTHTSVLDNWSTRAGGGIFNQGTTHVTDSLFDFDRAGSTGSATPPSGHGGAIASVGGTVTVTTSTIGNSHAIGIGNAGAIFADGGATVTVDRSTLSGNTAAGDASGRVSTIQAGTANVTIRSSTLAENAGELVGTPPSTLDADVLSGHSFDITSTTIADNTGSAIGPATIATMRATAIQGDALACRSTVTSGGWNAVADATCNLNGPGDVMGPTPLVGLLADNGGPTQTNLPFANSPLLDAIPPGTAAVCPATGSVDQRGVARPANGRCDIGAVERAAAG